jgi:hypothetical protein
MTDREVAVATFKAVAALYYAVTGQPLRLTVETETETETGIGTVTINGGCYPAEARQAQSADLAGFHPKQSS